MKLKLGRLVIKTLTLDSNSHGRGFTTLKSTVRKYPLQHLGVLGRIYGWRFYIYWKDGSNWSIDFIYDRRSIF